MEALRPTELRNQYVHLIPTVVEHAAEFAAIGEDASIWTFLAPEPFQGVGDAQKWIRAMLSRPGYAATYSVFDAKSGKLAGTTSFLNVSPGHGSMEIGFTWYGKDYQRTYINTATKLAMLAYAFETVDATRVQFQTDARNELSQRAIARIGGVKEGVLRKHKKYPTGFIRDTVVFSIIAEEWPMVRSNLEQMLSPRS